MRAWLDSFSRGQWVLGIWRWMRKRKLGETGLEVSELSLGTWGLSGGGYGPVSERDQDAVIDRARVLGITLIDTADIYGSGEMESKLGKRLAHDEDCIIVTKIGTDWMSDPKRKRFDVPYLRDALERSRDRLQRDPLDVVLLHNPSEKAIRTPGAAELLQQWVDEGKLKAWGVSAGDAKVARASLEVDPIPQVIELAVNVLCSSDLRAVRHLITSKKVGLLARSVLAHGLLTGLWAPDKVFDREDHRSDRWTADQLRRRVHQLRALRSVISPRVSTSRGAAVAYVLEEPCVSSAILGPRNTLQLLQLVREVPKEPPYLEARKKQHLEVQLNRMRVNG